MDAIAIVPAVSLRDRVMGKMGSSYTRAEIVRILRHYNIRPQIGQKVHLFRQLHELAAREDLQSARQRRRLLAQPIPVIPLPLPPQDVEPAINEEKTCSICAEDMLPEMFPTQKITADCTHETDTCTACLQRCIETQLESKTWNNLSCPSCRSEISFETVRALCSAEVFERYDRLAVLHAIGEMPNARECFGPGCRSSQIHWAGDDEPIMTCNSCGFKTCYTHQVPWHSDMTCKEYDAKNALQIEQIQASETLIRQVGMVCPNCVAPGIKVSGCDHMTCPRCSYEYCSLCLASYQRIWAEGNSAHQETCRHYSPPATRAHMQRLRHEMIQAASNAALNI